LTINKINFLLIIFSLTWIVFFISCKNYGRGYRVAHGGNYFGINPSMSPDGLKIVFGSPRYDRGDICTVNSDGSHWLRLTDTPDYEAEPSFSPDGSKIVFISERDDGNTGHIYIMNTDGSSQKQLTNTSHYDTKPAFSPDGKTIVFSRLLGDYNWEIFTINADGAGEKRLTFTESEESNPVFSADGKKILYKADGKSVRSALWSMDRDGSNQSIVMETMEHCSIPYYSPNGKMLVYTSSAETNFEVYDYVITQICVMNSDGSAQKKLTNTKSGKGNSTFTPDGKRILFFEFEPGGRGKGQIRIINVDGTNLRTIINNY
jgi:Tol biopolymer transport system component